MLLINLIFMLQGQSVAKLHELSTKQSVENIRYLSSDGKITYFQLRSGSLSVTNNFTNHTVFEKKFGTQYTVQVSQEVQKAVIEANEKFNSDYNLLKNNEIYLADYGATKSEKIGDGVSPQFHLAGTWISYYDIEKKQLHFKFTKFLNRELVLDTTNRVNPFFIPQAVVINPEIILYTDINSAGVMGVMKYNVTEKKIYPLVKSPQNGVRLEICKKDNFVIVGQFSYPTLNRGSSIYKLSIDSSGMTTSRKDVYSSEEEDIGHIVCDTKDSNIFFVKNLTTNKRHYSEAASLNLDNQKLTVLSDLKFVSNIIAMDKKVLLPFRDKFYLLVGENEKNTITNP